MDKHAIEYCKKSKENFDGDGWWNSTPENLIENPEIIGINWMANHDNNDDYWDILYGDINKEWSGKVALDYGFGFGGNIRNLFGLCDWKMVHGCEIAPTFIPFANKYLEKLGYDPTKISLHETNGYDLAPIESDSIDFVTSIVVLQHIALYQVRYNILLEFYRVMKEGGLLSFQMNISSGVGYYTREVDLNKRPNCRLANPENMVKDLEEIGFKDITYELALNPANRKKNGWCYFKAYK